MAFIKYISFNLVMALYVCDQCGKSFTLSTNLSRHKQVHVNGKFSCNNCFLKFSSQLSLDQHRRNVHGVNDEKPSGFCCEICGKSYKDKKNLIRHQHSHSKQDHKCNACNSSFKTERILKEIIDKTHSTKAYYCDQCEKSYNCNDYM